MVKIKKIQWCFKIKNGLEFTIFNIEISKNYIEESLKTLKKVDALIKEKDFLWATVMIYYSEYYALCSFLEAIGIKNENHDCSIELLKYLFKDLAEIIEKHKKTEQMHNIF